MLLQAVPQGGLPACPFHRGVVCHAAESAAPDNPLMAPIHSRAGGKRAAAVERMALTRSQLIDDLLALDAELLRLEAGGVEEEAIQIVLEHAVNSSTRTVDQRDRLWWWGQFYAVMDHHSARLMLLSVIPRTL